MFLIQAGFHGYTASLPLTLDRAGLRDSEIGLIVGVAALIQIPVALAAGPLIDWLGGIRLFLAGGLAFLAASALLILPGVDAASSTLPFIAARLLQGVGIALTFPAALSVVPRLVEAARHGLALSIAGLSQNLTLVVIPPLSLVVLDRWGLAGVGVFVILVVALGFGLTQARPLRPAGGSGPLHSTTDRRPRFGWRGSWMGPLVIELLFALHWGMISAYLPQRAEAAGADIGLYFAAAGVGILLARLPAGWAADRLSPLRPILVGLAVTFVGVALLLPAPTTPLLMVSGVLTGAGAGLIVTPLLLALTRRSDDADRGSAFALFSGAFAVALALGSVGAAPLIDRVGFELTLSVVLSGLVAATVVSFLDRGLASLSHAEPEIEHHVAAAPPVSP